MAGELKSNRIFTNVTSSDLPLTVGDELVTDDGICIWDGTEWVKAITEARIREIVREELKSASKEADRPEPLAVKASVPHENMTTDEKAQSHRDAQARYAKKH